MEKYRNHTYLKHVKIILMKTCGDHKFYKNVKKKDNKNYNL